MNVVICDDEKLYLQSIEEKILEWAQQNKHQDAIMIHSFLSSEDMLDAWEHGMNIDALFMDIQIPNELNGIDIAQKLHNVDETIPVAFVTGYGEYAEEGYKVSAVRYLRKPVRSEEIYDCMNIFWNRWWIRKSKCLILDTSFRIVQLPYDHILYLEVSGHYCTIHTIGSVHEYRFKKSLEDIWSQMSKQLFIQSHRSYIVNLHYVRHVSKNQIILSDGSIVPISRTFQSNFLKQFREYYLDGGT